MHACMQISILPLLNYLYAGVCLDSADSIPRPIVIKAKGKVIELRHKIESMQMPDSEVPINVHCGIAHTRWATHGPPSDANAHPHVSTFTLVLFFVTSVYELNVLLAAVLCCAVLFKLATIHSKFY